MPADFNNEFGQAVVYERKAITSTRTGPTWFPPGSTETSTEFRNVCVGTRNKSGHATSPLINGWRRPNGYYREIERFSGTGEVTYYMAIDYFNLKAGDFVRNISNIPFDGLAYTPEDRNGPYWVRTQHDLSALAELQALNAFTDGSASVGQNLAEAHKTASGLANVAKDMVDVYNGFRHRDIPAIYSALTGKKGLIKAISNRYLEYQFGIKPLMQDAKNLYNQLWDGPLKKDHLIRGVGTAHKSTSYNTHPDVKGETEAFVKVILYGSVQNEALIAVNRAGLLNPFSIAWELVPYSFLIDWALPIGQTLSAFSATAGLAFKGGSASHTVNSHADVNVPLGTSNAWYESPNSDTLTGKIESKTFGRSTYGSFPVPSLAFKSPLSTTHIAEAGALVLGMR